MKILIVGGNGTIGKAVSEFFRKDHEVLVAGRSTGDVILDMTDSESIRSMYQSFPDIDALVCIAGEAKWAPFESLSEADYDIGLRSKLMGQVNLVRIGMEYLKLGGSFTLSTGILADDPVPMTTSAAMVNGAIHSFVQAAGLEMRDGLRVNVVSSGLVDASAEKYADYFPGHNPIPMWKTVNAYVKSVMGKGNGKVIRIYE